MGIFQLIEKKKEFDPGDPYGVYDWGKPSKAVIACDGRGEGCVLWFAGAHIDFELNESGMRTLGDLGLDDAPEGISIWEGKYVGTRHETMDGIEYDTEVDGEFREPTQEEWASICQNDSPWNMDDWLRDDLPPWVRCEKCGQLDPQPVGGDDCNMWQCLVCGHRTPEMGSARLQDV